MSGQPAAGLYVELRALVAKFSQDMDGAVKTVLGTEKKITSAFNTIQKVGQAALVIGGVFAVKKLADAVVDLADKGERASGIADNFKAIGGAAEAIQQARERILGTVDSFELMRIASSGLMKEIPALNENFGLIAEYGNKVADTLGGDTKESIQQVVDALATAKDKQLQAVGIIIDTEKAYKTYAEQIGTTADKLDELQQKEARQIAAIEAMNAKNSQMAEIGKSVTQGQERINAAIEEGLSILGQAINDNDELAEAWNNLAEQIEKIDWNQVGQDIANVLSMVTGMISDAIPAIQQFFHEFVVGAEVLAHARKIMTITGRDFEGALNQARDFVATNQKLQAEIGKYSKFKSELQTVGDKIASARTKADVEKLIPTLGRLTGEYVKMRDAGEQVDGIKNDLISTTLGLEARMSELPEKIKPVIKHTGLSAKALDDQAKAAKKAADEIAKLKEKWSDFVQKQNQEQLKNNFDDAIEQVNFVAYGGIREQLAKAVHDGFVEEWKDAISSGAVSLDEVENEAKKTVDAILSESDKKLQDVISENAKRAQEEFASAFDSLAGVFSDIAGQFGVDLSNVANLFSTLLSDEAKAGLMQAISEALGVQLSSKDIAAWGSVATQVIGSGLDAKGTDKSTKSNKGSGAAAGTAVGAVAGGIIGSVIPVIGTAIGAAIGAAIGNVAGGLIGGMFKWGPQDPSSKARHAFANFVEDGFHKLGAVSFFDAQGRMNQMRGSDFNFREGSTSRFNQPGWAGNMDSWGENAKQTFLGMGEALRELQGISEDVGGQIGYLLGENLAGNIDNARLMVQQLGLTFEEMEEALFQAARKGNLRWAEFEINVAGVAEAFKPGLVAVGDLKGAMDELIGSGGRGVEALKGVRDSAVEAMEKGAKTIQEMGQMMMAQGVDPTLVNDFLEALRERGIKTLQDLANASDRVAGGIVAELESNNEGLKAQWEQMTNDLKGIADLIEKIPTEKDIQINVKSNFDSNTQSLIDNNLIDPGQTDDGGVDTGETTARRALRKRSLNVDVGAMGRTPAVNARRTNFAGMVSSQKQSPTIIYQVDSRGAAPGQEFRMKQALREFEERAVRRAVHAVADAQRRGGRF